MIRAAPIKLALLLTALTAASFTAAQESELRAIPATEAARTLTIDAELLAEHPALLRARERQVRLLRSIPDARIRFEDTATASRTYVDGLPPGTDQLQIESAEDVQAVLSALAPYLGLTEHDRYDHIVEHGMLPAAATWLAIPTPNGHMVLNRALILMVDPDDATLRGINGIIEHGARLPTEPVLAESEAIEHALAAVGDRTAWAAEGHGAYPVYAVGEPTCLLWQVLLEPAAENANGAEDAAVVYVFADGSTTRDRGRLRCPEGAED